MGNHFCILLGEGSGRLSMPSTEKYLHLQQVICIIEHWKVLKTFIAIAFNFRRFIYQYQYEFLLEILMAWTMHFAFEKGGR